MKNRIVVVGAGASGKDHYKRLLVSKGWKPSVSYTTRPPRANEVDGIDYHFVNVEQFEYMVKQKMFLEFDCFNNWYYGTPYSDFLDKDVFIMTPTGVRNIPAADRANTLIIYLDIDEQIRRDRLTARKDADDAERRLNEDKKFFEGFKEFLNSAYAPYVRITNPDF